MSEVFQQTPAGKRKVYRGRMWKNVKEPNLCGMWEHFSCDRSKAKKFRELADEEKQAGIHGQWQQESPAREYLEQVKCCHDTDCNEPMMKKGFTALEWNVGPQNGLSPVDRYTSRVVFRMQFAHLIACVSHCMAQDEPPNVSVCALHSTFMSSMMCA